MAANVETMFYAGETPWHGLGVQVEHAMSSANALELAGLNWTVSKREIQTVDGFEVPGFYATVRDSDNKPLGVVKDRYQVVQNSEAFAFVDNLLGEGVTYETAGSLNGGKRVWLLAKTESANILGDTVDPYLVFSNSHDGSGAVQVAVTPIRVVCQNTLTLALSTAKRTWSARHSGSIGSKMLEAEQTLGLTRKYIASLNEQADLLTQIVVPAPAFVEFLHAMLPYPKNEGEMTDLVKNRIDKEREFLSEIYNNKDDIQRFKGTAWGVLNAVADFVPHVAPRRNSKTIQDKRFQAIVDGSKNGLMERACKYYNV